LRSGCEVGNRCRVPFHVRRGGGVPARGDPPPGRLEGDVGVVVGGGDLRLGDLLAGSLGGSVPSQGDGDREVVRLGLGDPLVAGGLHQLGLVTSGDVLENQQGVGLGAVLLCQSVGADGAVVLPPTDLGAGGFGGLGDGANGEAVQIHGLDDLGLATLALAGLLGAGGVVDGALELEAQAVQTAAPGDLDDGLGGGHVAVADGVAEAGNEASVVTLGESAAGEAGAVVAAGAGVLFSDEFGGG